MNKKIVTLYCVIGLLGFALINSFLLSDAFRGNHINAENASQFGSFIGGYFGTILTFISMIIMIITLINQIKTTTHDKFESKYFELIRLHRENVIEMYLGDDTGRKVFVKLIREYREILTIIRNIIKENEISITDPDLLNITYLVFYYGVGPNSTRVMRDALINTDKKLVDLIINKFDSRELKNKIKVGKKLGYIPFEGHQSRLGHYYRHLYQTVCYVDTQKILTNDEKKEYIKMLRAQLSTHEQALLVLNSHSQLGKNWIKKDLITTYELVKNIPKNFFHEKKELDIKKVFPNIIFEWEE